MENGKLDTAQPRYLIREFTVTIQSDCRLNCCGSPMPNERMILVMNKLKELRQSYGLTQKEVAHMLHITRSAYAQYESGAHQPSLDVMEQLADFYSVNLEYICGRSEYSQPLIILQDHHRELIDAISSLTEFDLHVFLYLFHRIQQQEISLQEMQLFTMEVMDGNHE